MEHQAIRNKKQSHNQLTLAAPFPTTPFFFVTPAVFPAAVPAAAGFFRFVAVAAAGAPAPAPAPAALVLLRFCAGAVSGTVKTRGRELPVCERVPSRAISESLGVWFGGVGSVFSKVRGNVSKLSTLCGHRQAGWLLVRERAARATPSLAPSPGAPSTAENNTASPVRAAHLSSSNKSPRARDAKRRSVEAS